jgi:hypothetical protein
MELTWVLLSVLAALCAIVVCSLMAARSRDMERRERERQEREPILATIVDTNLDSHAGSPTERSPADSASDKSHPGKDR